MAIKTEESLPGGMTPQFVVDTSALGSTYWNGTMPSSIDELAIALRAAASYRSPVAAMLIGIVVAGCLALVINEWLFFAVIVVGILFLAWASTKTARRRCVAVVYRLDVSAAHAYDSLSKGVGWLAHSRAVWRITHEETVQRPANTTSITRVPAQVKRGDVPNLLTNVTALSIAAGSETLLFLPDSILIRDGANFVDVPYSFVRVDCEMTRFSESQSDPGDSRRLAASWLYANKDGSPDRRRANNRQIPVLEYTRVTLSWRRTAWVLLVSNAEAARHFANALQAMSQLGRPQQVTLASPPPRASATPRTERAPKPVAFFGGATPRTVDPLPTVAATTAATTVKAISKTLNREVKMPPQRPDAPTDLELALQASIDRKRRLDELERQAAVNRAQGESARAPISAAQALGQWIGPGGSATVHGFATGDCVYVGVRLSARDGSRTEPSLINPALPIDPLNANTAGAGITYWPSYAGISAASRTAFLQWLAGGRKDPGAYIGYVFIFFYGLERRVLELMQDRVSSGDELFAIAREVARLLDLYGGRSSSFASYGSSFLDLISSIEPRARGLGDDAERRDFGVPHRLKILLGELSLAGKPIPARHALEWVRSTCSLNTPAVQPSSSFSSISVTPSASAMA